MRDERIGYLHEDFKFFYIKDKGKLDFDYHHHNFNKLVVLLSGELTYIIEGQSYTLQPWDILLVGENEIHKPITNPDKTYERIIFWLKPEDTTILKCFDIAKQDKHNSLRLNRLDIEPIKTLLNNIKDCQHSDDFGNEVLVKALFMQLMVYINRFFIQEKHLYENNYVHHDKTIDKVTDFIEQNLEQKLSIDVIANECFISKYYLMRKFKATIGISIHNYIINKRLGLAKELILKGYSLNEVSIRCGFNDYSTFVRCFKKVHKVSPSKYNPDMDNFNAYSNYE